MSLRDPLVDAVGPLDDVETTLTPDGAITWSLAQRRPFAVLTTPYSASRPRTSASQPGK